MARGGPIKTVRVRPGALSSCPRHHEDGLGELGESWAAWTGWRAHAGSGAGSGAGGY